jgi:hypothetical protein
MLDLFESQMEKLQPQQPRSTMSNEQGTMTCFANDAYGYGQVMGPKWNGKVFFFFFFQNRFYGLMETN